MNYGSSIHNNARAALSYLGSAAAMSNQVKIEFQLQLCVINEQAEPTASCRWTD